MTRPDSRTWARMRSRRWTPSWRSCRTVSWLAMVMFALLALVALADAASAHAALESTTPADRSEMATAPERVAFTFNEEVTAASGALRVFDSEGARVDDATQVQPGPETVAVGLDDLPAGGYLATYLVTSADGHVVRGAISFQVGGGRALDDATVAALFAGGGDAVVGWLQRLATVVQYGAALVALGALVPMIRDRRAAPREAVAGLVGSDRGGAGEGRDRAAAGLDVSPTGRDRRATDPPAGSAAGSDVDADADVAVVAVLERRVATETVATVTLWGMGASLVAIPLQAMVVSGQGLSALASGSIMAGVLTSAVGLANLTMVAGLLGMYAGARGRPRPEQLGGAAVLVAASFLLAGHTMTATPTWVLLAADFVHVAAAGIWAGGLVVVWRTWRRSPHAAPAARAAMVARFSRIALWAMVAVAGAGVAMVWALARQPRALVTTDWGWTLVVKVGLVVVVLAIAGYNRWRLVPVIDRAGPDGQAARDQLATTMRVEVVLLAAILLASVVLTGLRPAAAEAGIAGAFDTVVSIDDTSSVNLVVDPNQAGDNQLHVYLLDATGRPTDDVDEVTLELRQVDEDVGPIVRSPAPAGPGHWILTGNDLAIPGRWRVTVVVGVDRFTEERVDVDVVVNPAS